MKGLLLGPVASTVQEPTWAARVQQPSAMGHVDGDVLVAVAIAWNQAGLWLVTPQVHRGRGAMGG